MVQRQASTAAPADHAAPGQVRLLEAALNSVIRGKPDVVRMALVGLLARGHLLIEDVPGVGKTTLAHALARAIDCGFQRVQFTADMLPGDVLGVTILNAQTREFEFKKGPVFTNILLADEINRSTPKTQSALLEAMNELQVTIDGHSYPLDPPFMVIATQNPVEHHGTYPLPESQLDRFLLLLRIGYPDRAAELEILRQVAGGGGGAGVQLQPVLTAAELLALQNAAAQVRVERSVADYMLAIVERTRNSESLVLGVSPRGAQALYRATQALALIEGRDYALPEDVKRLAVPVFAHRVMVNTRMALAQRGTDPAIRLIEEILTLVDVPL
ncbi:MAG: MoxR family ATPase [Acidobacteria bacterium]|nr:MoxR family ATPase [Acidobacteriota bacterium]